MSEEIDIIELFKRAKEGKAPKEIEVNGTKYRYFKDWMTLDETYFTKAHGGEENLCYCEMDFMTKIKILDKPIIEEIEIYQDDDGNDKAMVYPLNDGTNDKLKNYAVSTIYIARKINEIIRAFNNKEKK